MPEIILPDGSSFGVGEDESLELEMLQAAIQNKIVLGVDEAFDKPTAQRSFIRLVESDHLRLLDVIVVPRPAPRLCRIFAATALGKARCQELVNKANLKAKLANH